MNTAPFDLEQFRAHGNRAVPPTAPKLKRQPLRRDGGRFLRGPIPLSWLAPAAVLPGKALHVAIALWFLSGLKRSSTVKLTGSLRSQFGILPDAGRRGLAALERAGLVFVERPPGCCPRVTILDAPPVNGQETETT